MNHPTESSRSDVPLPGLGPSRNSGHRAACVFCDVEISLVATAAGVGASLMDDESGGLEKAAIGAAHAVRESVAFDSIYELGDEVGERYSCENDSSH